MRRNHEASEYINPEDLCKACSRYRKCGIPEQITRVMLSARPGITPINLVDTHLLEYLASQNDGCLVGKYVRSRLPSKKSDNKP